MTIYEVYIQYQDLQSDVFKEHRLLQSETHNRMKISIKPLTHVTEREYCF